MENKEKNIQLLNDEELENVSGGFQNKARFDKIGYRCTACGFQNFFRLKPDKCPECNGAMAICEILFK